MFNRTRIIEMQWRIDDLLRENESQQKQIWELRADLEKLAQYLRVEFVNVNERCVQEVTPQSE